MITQELFRNGGLISWNNTPARNLAIIRSLKSDRTDRLHLVGKAGWGKSTALDLISRFRPDLNVVELDVLFVSWAAVELDPEASEYRTTDECSKALYPWSRAKTTVNRWYTEVTKMKGYDGVNVITGKPGLRVPELKRLIIVVVVPEYDRYVEYYQARTNAMLENNLENPEFRAHIIKKHVALSEDVVNNEISRFSNTGFKTIKILNTYDNSFATTVVQKTLLLLPKLGLK
jgi:hypothetical protein